MRRALLVPFLSTHFIELQRVARLLKESGRWEPVFHFPRPYPELAANTEACTRAGWTWTAAEGAIGAGVSSARTTPPSLPLWRRTFRGLPAPLRAPLLSLGQYALRRRAFQRIGRIARELLAGKTLLILAEDNLDYLTAGFIRAGHDAGIASVIVPFTVANQLESAEAYAQSEAHRVGFLGRRFARRHPQWVYVHHGRELLRLPVAEALATEHLGLAPPHPWMLNSGHADAIAVESDAMLAHYRACGFGDSQLVLTGALYDDVLAATAREAAAVRRELGLDDRPILLCALPPDQTDVRTPEQCAFQSYEEISRHWISTLSAAKAFQVVVSLHPRTRAETMIFIETLGATIVRGDIARLIPLASLYVASVSATIRLAIASAIPVVNYDVYRYRYTDFAAVPGVVTMEDRAAFEETIRSLTSEGGTALLALAAAQRSSSSRWGRLDGGAGGRMLDLFERLALQSAERG